MVMEYISEGNLRNFLQNSNHEEIDLNEKIEDLKRIAAALNRIHKHGLVHSDLHAGNILVEKTEDEEDISFSYYITDLGLCRPANESEKRKVYGSLPCVAPEILKELFKNTELRKITYTQASDIYSFGMIVYEYIFNVPPYYDNVFNKKTLACEICSGLRPNLNLKPIPLLLKNFINSC